MSPYPWTVYVLIGRAPRDIYRPPNPPRRLFR